ncbi:hypothetical protein FSP39_022391 [Pinctada imbricata]|uniref:CCHC-type domain-containing protein n=1 Tax=Pinctada imbricata TaxID=66713 RepID=A0AA89BRQ4_PINIB|nr:hypothetical protein FSP39_022391 [Pinctada imbricata]
MDLYRAQLKDRRQKASESVPELGQNIRRLTHLAYAKAPSDVRETLAMENFIEALHNSDMRIRIKQSRPKNLNEAVCLAVELDAFNSTEKRRADTVSVRAAESRVSNELSPVLKFIEETNKALTDIRADIQSLKSNKTLGNVRNGSDSKSQGKTNLRCYYCNKEGHIKKKCYAFLNAQKKRRTGQGNGGPKGQVKQQESVQEKKAGSSNVISNSSSMGSTNLTGQSGMFLTAKINDRSQLVG